MSRVRIHRREIILTDSLENLMTLCDICGTSMDYGQEILSYKLFLNRDSYKHAPEQMPLPLERVDLCTHCLSEYEHQLKLCTANLTVAKDRALKLNAR